MATSRAGGTSDDLDILGDLRRFSREFEPHLEAFFTERRAAIPEALPEARQMLAYLREFCQRGGKRLRPWLVATGWEMAGGTVGLETSWRLSVIVELVHNFLLIHDDVMDQDVTRRGGPTMQRIYSQQYPGAAVASEQYGDAMGILSGDLLYTLLWPYLVASAPPSARLNQVILGLSEAVALTIHGQELDITLGLATTPTVDEVLTMYRYKTAHYSFVMPLLVGVTATSIDAKQRVALEEYGINCGIAFQIQDDILGLVGDERVTGKSTESDLNNKKRTLLMAAALEHGAVADQAYIRNILAPESTSVADPSQVRDIIGRSGALEYCRELGRQHSLAAEVALEQLPLLWHKRPAYQRLLQLPQFLIERTQ